MKASKLTMVAALLSVVPHVVAALPPHPNWSNTLKPRGIPGPLLLLASNGHARYTILLPAEPTTQDQKAAEDLAYYLKRMSGAEFAIVNESDAPPPDRFISIGRTRSSPMGLPDLRLDGYAIAVRGDNLYLAGGSRRGPINAVYCLLEEDLGCRWFDSTPQHAVIPHMPELRFEPVPRTYTPQFEIMRWLLVFEAKSVEAALLNRAMDCDQYRKFPGEWGGIHTMSGIHTLPGIIKPEQYFEEHPEYFSMVDGKRVPEQVCMSNDDVFSILLKHTLESEYPWVTLSSRDGPTYCACAPCQAVIDDQGTTGAAQLKMVSAVAAEVAKVQPDKKVVFLAYQSTAKPPKNLRPHANVIVWLCSDAHGFGPATHYISETPRFQQYLQGWKDLGATISIWEYVTYFGTNQHTAPLPNLHVVGEDLRWLAKQGVQGMLLQGCLWGPADRGHLRSWVWAKQMWNPSLDTDDLIRDFTYGYYGKAAEPILAYENLSHNLWERWHHSTVSIEKKRGGVPPIDTAFLSKAKVLFDRAEKLAVDDAMLLTRVHEARIPILFHEVVAGIGRAESADPPLPADDPYWKVVDQLIDYKQRCLGNWPLFANYDVLKRVDNARQGKVSPSKPKFKTLESKFGRVRIMTLPAAWRFAVDPEKIGIEKTWYATAHDDKDWQPIRVDLDTGWQAQGFAGADADAFGWYRLRAEVPLDFEKRKLYLVFEAVDEDAYIYLNGIKVFEHSCKSTGLTPQVIWDRPFACEVTGHLTPGGENLFTVGVYNRAAMAGVWKNVHLIAADAKIDEPDLLNLIQRQ